MSGILITLGCVVLTLSAVGFWVATQVSNTDRYVANVAPLASDPSIQGAVATRTTDALVKALDVPAVLDEVVGFLESEGLPAKIGDRLDALAGPLVSGLESFIQKYADKVVQSDQFATIWTGLNRAAHTQLDAVLSGEGSKILGVQGDTVTLQLGPVIDVVKQQLVAAGMTIAGSVPELNPTITLFENADLVRWQGAYQWLVTLKWALPVVALVLLVGGVWLARGRRRAVLGAGLGVAAGMLILVVALVIGRGMYLSAVAQNGLNQEAAGSLFDTLVRFLRYGAWALLAVGLLTALAAYLAGPSRPATRLRRLFS